MAKGKATPVEIKEANGTVNITRDRRKAEVRYNGDQNKEITLAPDSLGPDGQRLWNANVAQLASVGMNFPSVYEYMESYCRAYEIREEAYKELKETGMYVMEGETETKPGVRRVSQPYKVYNEQIDKMIIIGAKLGFTPVDKTKISMLVADIGESDKNNQKSIGVRG